MDCRRRVVYKVSAKGPNDTGHFQRRTFLIRSAAWASLSLDTVRVKRIYPSPDFPKPLPGVAAIPAFFRRNSQKVLDVYPLGTCIQR